MNGFKEHIPQGHISKFVESYWEYEGEEMILLPPDGTFSIIFSKTPFILIGKNTYQLCKGVYLLPIHTNSWKIYVPNSIVALRLKAFTFPLFFKQKKFLWNSLGGCFQLNDAFKSEDLGSFVAEILHSSTGELDQVLREKVNYILDRRGDVLIQDMEQHFGTSRQSIYTSFKNSMRISPKQLAAIWKLNNFIVLAARNGVYTHSAFDAGYCDQAHSIKACKQYVGMTPSAFFRQNQKANIDFVLSCIDKRFSNGYDPMFSKVVN